MSCQQENTVDDTPEKIQDITVTEDTISEQENISTIAIVDTNIILFKKQFKYSFPDTVDFGWRYIASNYETSDIKIKGIKYDEKHNLNTTHFFNMNGEPLGKEIEGYAHSYKRINADSILFLTMINGEISQGFMLYITNNKLKVLQNHMIASNGGDEGSWFYKFGAFDKEFNYYTYEEIEGFAKDTMEMISDTLWLRKK